MRKLFPDQPISLTFPGFPENGNSDTHEFEINLRSIQSRYKGVREKKKFTKKFKNTKEICAVNEK